MSESMTMQMPDIADFLAVLDESETSAEGRRLRERFGDSANALPYGVTFEAVGIRVPAQ